MKIKSGLLLTFSILISCSSKKDDILTIDTLSQIMIHTLGQEEQAIWDYYQEIESQILKDEKATKDQMIEYVQSLIDKGLIDEPIIHVETEKGTETKIVEYKAYKEFRKKNPIDSNRHYIFRLNSKYEQDSIYADSMRRIILNELKADSIKNRKD